MSAGLENIHKIVIVSINSLSSISGRWEKNILNLTLLSKCGVLFYYLFFGNETVEIRLYYCLCSAGGGRQSNCERTSEKRGRERKLWMSAGREGQQHTNTKRMQRFTSDTGPHRPCRGYEDGGREADRHRNRAKGGKVRFGFRLR